ncbi:hypothetical protein EYF80_016365 [Liparis tanakae]|uniref:Uncharacterized protein n=1 Tax=Liparis tanakae TaxID=230148 RepID=A0A4Z2I6N9_9TELE|nr:hypothetical protein EYF80_016365 [Liparis tanakae]
MLTVEEAAASRESCRGMVAKRRGPSSGPSGGSSRSACTAAVTLLERVILRHKNKMDPPACELNSDPNVLTVVSHTWATAEVVAVAVAVMVIVLLVTCWLAGPCTCALAASMAAVRAFMLSMLSVELDRPGWELMPVRVPEPPSM